MCVIAVCSTHRVEPDDIELMHRRNPDGAGVAWKEADGIHWKKGSTDVAEMQDLAATLPLPHVLHFRIATVGAKGDLLCHPFPVSDTVPLDSEGVSQSGVVFHNGTWGDYDKVLAMTAPAAGVRLPKGPWSDSRAMAWLVNRCGPHYLEMLTGQRTVFFSPDELEMYGWGWKRIDNVWLSNDHHIPTVVQTYGSFHNQNSFMMCRYGRCTSKETDTDGYCASHQDEKPDWMKNRDKAALAQKQASDKDLDERADAIMKALEDKESKPAHNHVNSTALVKLAAPVMVAVKTETSGGKSLLLPFHEVHQLYLRMEVSKNQYKKARTQYMNQLSKRANAMDVKDLPRA